MLHYFAISVKIDVFHNEFDENLSKFHELLRTILFQQVVFALFREKKAYHLAQGAGATPRSRWARGRRLLLRSSHARGEGPSSSGDGDHVR